MGGGPFDPPPPSARVNRTVATLTLVNHSITHMTSIGRLHKRYSYRCRVTMRAAGCPPAAATPPPTPADRLPAAARCPPAVARCLPAAATPPPTPADRPCRRSHAPPRRRHSGLVAADIERSSFTAPVSPPSACS